MGSRASLDAMPKRKISASAKNRGPIVDPVVCVQFLNAFFPIVRDSLTLMQDVFITSILKHLQIKLKQLFFLLHC